MGNPGCENEDVTRCHRVFLVESLENDLAFESMDAQRPGGVVDGKKSARRESHHGEAQGSFFHESARRSAVLLEQLLVEHPLIVSEVIDENFSFDRSVH